MNKPRLKLRYKELVRAGRLEEAQIVLQKVWNYDGDSPVEKPELKKPKVKKKEESLKDLQKIKGIGKKTLLDLERLYTSLKDLKKDLDKDKVPLRDDVVNKLKKYFRRR